MPSGLLPQESQKTVGTSAVDVFNEVDAAVERSVTNISTSGQVIYLGIGQDAVVGKGIVVPPGSVYSQAIDARYTPDAVRWSAISSGASGLLATHQRVA